MAIMMAAKTMELLSSKFVAGALGLVSHWVLHCAEWDRYSHLICLIWMGAFGSMTVVEYVGNPRVGALSQALRLTSTIATVYFVTLLSSVLVYRGFFHRLRKFPGPFLVRLSKFFSLPYVIPHFQYYKEVEKLHRKYKSDIIRTGPRELSIIDVNAIPLVHGPLTKCGKGPWYDMFKHMEGESIHTTRSKQAHKDHRKVWDHALNAQSLRTYEPRVNSYMRILMEKLDVQAEQKSVRLSDWVSFYSFDVMGDIGFNRSFGMLETGKMDWVINLIHGGMAAMSVFTHIPYVASLLTRMGAGGDVLRLMAWAHGTLEERKQACHPDTHRETPKPLTNRQKKERETDVVGWLLNCDNKDITNKRALNAAARLLVVAGSDTTAASLAWTFYELCKNPPIQSKLREILDTISPEKPVLDAADVAKIPYLDGIINEGLRLHPAVPSGVQRETPPEGLTLPTGTFVPGHTQIWMPMHTIQRDPRNFSSPLTFAPERWMKLNTSPPESASSSVENSPVDSPATSQIPLSTANITSQDSTDTSEKSELTPSPTTSRSSSPTSPTSPTSPSSTPYTANPRAFMPFTTGAHRCAGEKLAMMEMRTVIANIVRRYEVRFAEGEDGSSMEKKTQDCFTINVGTLDVRLARRGEGERGKKKEKV